jgi:hypothetical protein
LKSAEHAGKLWKLPLCGNRGKTKKQFSTVPTSLGKLSAKSARRVFHSSHSFGGEVSSKKETGEKRRDPAVSNRNWVEGGTLRVVRNTGWPSRKSITAG